MFAVKVYYKIEHSIVPTSSPWVRMKTAFARLLGPTTGTGNEKRKTLSIVLTWREKCAVSVQVCKGHRKGQGVVKRANMQGGLQDGRSQLFVLCFLVISSKTRHINVTLKLKRSCLKFTKR